MNYTQLFFYAVFINSFLIAVMTCSQDNRNTRLLAYQQAITVYNDFEEDRLYTTEGEIITIKVQRCLQTILQHNDIVTCSSTLQKIMQEQSSTDDLLNKSHLNDIARRLKIAYKK